VRLTDVDAEFQEFAVYARGAQNGSRSSFFGSVLARLSGPPAAQAGRDELSKSRTTGILSDARQSPRRRTLSCCHSARFSNSSAARDLKAADAAAANT
jgi:hypothetical protein